VLIKKTELKMKITLVRLLSAASDGILIYS